MTPGPRKIENAGDLIKSDFSGVRVTNVIGMTNARRVAEAVSDKNKYKTTLWRNYL